MEVFLISLIVLLRCDSALPHSQVCGAEESYLTAAKLLLSLRSERGRTCGIYCKARAESTEALREKEVKTFIEN